MADALVAPSSSQVVRAIAHRELLLGARRRMVKLLFLGSLIPPIVITVIIVVRIMAEQATGMDLDWDPLLQFLKIQALLVALLALSLGTPSVARDRAEDVLFLYATRPVLPWHYALGKMMGVGLPACGLMLVPGILIAVLRVGVTGDMGAEDAVLMILKILVVAALGAWAYAGVTVGPSAATKRGRWALLIALAFFVLPDALGELIWSGENVPLGPGSAMEALLDAFFEGRNPKGLLGAGVLLLYGGLGWWVITQRVRREMIP